MTEPLSLENLKNIFRTSEMDPSRIVNREGTKMEFKESYNHGNMAQYFKAMAAFANNSGGYIIFGVGDNPRRLVGLKDKSLAQFEGLKVEDLTKNLLDYFSPEIKWEHRTFEYLDMSFGVIYVHELLRKPCICKKRHDANDNKYSLKEGDIYYRYGGRSERIHYEELMAIIEKGRKDEEKQWLEFMKKAARIGVESAALLDLNTGQLSGNSGSVFIDRDLLDKISFIQEGKIVEENGSPVFRIIGDVTPISPGKIIVKESTKTVVLAIEPSDIIRAFLQNLTVDEPLKYVKRICSASSANYPIYFFLQQAHATIQDALSLVDGTTSRSNAKKKLIERLKGKIICQTRMPRLTTISAKQKVEYYHHWITETMPEIIENINYCMNSILYLSKQEIIDHRQYICSIVLDLFGKEYEMASSNIATNMRIAICRIDEALYLEN